MIPTIRPAAPADAEALAALIRELAAYEKLADQARATADDLRGHLFGPRPAAEALIAEVDGAPAGFALFFPNFSTFEGRPGLYLEDIFVRPSHRGLGLGKALFARVAALAVERECARLDWAVLDWNAPAIAFYRARGARPLDDWTTFRLDGEALRAAAAGPDDGPP